MHLVHQIVGWGFAALSVYIAVTVYMSYRKNSSLTGWARWRATAMDSATMLWGKFSLLIAGIVANLDTFFNAVGLPQVTDAINKYADPRIAAAIIAVIAAGSMIFRSRTISSS